MNARHSILTLGLTAAIAACGSWSAGGIISVPYWNDFSVDADDFATLGTWTLDSTNQVYNTTISGASTESRALVTASDLGGPAATAKSFWISSDFTINQLSGGSPATVGLRALSTYTADIQEGGGMRIWGGGLSTSVIDTFAGGLKTDTLYTMSLLGTYYGGELTLEFSVTDGTLTNTVSRAGIASPATGQDFGIRNRTSSTFSQPLDVDFHNFTLIPEPSSLLLAVLGLVALVPLRRSRGRTHPFSRERAMRQVKAILVTCVFAVVAVGVGQPSQAEILTATLLEDTYVQTGLGGDNSNYSNAGYLWVRNHSTVSRLALAQFELPQLPAGMTASSIGEVWLSGTVYRSAASNQELEVLVLGTNPDMTTVNYNDITNAEVVEQLTGNYNFLYGSGATLLKTWTGMPQGSSGTEPHYHRVTYTDDNAVDGLLHWVQQTISDTEPTTLTLAFGPRGSAGTCDFRFWSMEGAAGASNNPPAGFLPAIPLTLTLIPEPSAAVLGLLALAGGLILRPRGRRKELV